MSRRTEVSAGILAFRRKRKLELLLAHPGGPYWRSRDDGAWSIPKGLVESGDPLVCAKREFNEETGLTALGPFITLTPARQKSGKLVHAFAQEADYDLSNFSSNSFEMEWPPRSGKMQNVSGSGPHRLFHGVDRAAQDFAGTAAIHRGAGRLASRKSSAA